MVINNNNVGPCLSSLLKGVDWPGKNFLKSHQAKIAALNQKDLEDLVPSALKISNNLKLTGQTNSMAPLKVYSASDSPPTLAVRMCLKHLGVPFEIVNVDFANGEQVSEAFLKKNPQGEVPYLDDNGFGLSESVAILQYLADNYKRDETFYPADIRQRAVVNQRFSFHLSTYYKSIFEYMVLPIFYAYQRTDENKAKVDLALKVFNEILTTQDSPYAAGEYLTIADLSLIMATGSLEAMDYDFTPYPKIKEWYESFKTNQPELWEIAKVGLDELKGFEKNPPDLKHVNHRIHPTDKSTIKPKALYI